MRTTENKINLYKSIFRGLETAYGSYDLKSGKYYHCKEQVNNKVIYNHLKGTKPYGIYPLVGSTTYFGVVDFDTQNPEGPISFVNVAKHYELATYLEKSKAKGYHVWLFFEKSGILAKKVRAIVKFILDEIGCKDEEIFPKQNSITSSTQYGNFINAPLNGKLVKTGKTVFVEPNFTLKPFPNQWELLESIKFISEGEVDQFMEINEIKEEPNQSTLIKAESSKKKIETLPICIRKILEQGVQFDQRIASFRLAVHLKRVGIPEDMAVILLLQWRLKNKPKNSKRVITESEINDQVNWAYTKNYSGYGCEEAIIRSFCSNTCFIKKT